MMSCHCILKYRSWDLILILMEEKNQTRENPKKEIEKTGQFEVRKRIVKPGHHHNWITLKEFCVYTDVVEWVVYCRDCGLKAFD